MIPFFVVVIKFICTFILFWRFTYTYNSLSSSSFLCSPSPAYVTDVKSTGFLKFYLFNLYNLLKSILFWKLILSIFRLLNAKNIIQALYILCKICSNTEKKQASLNFFIDNNIFLLEGTISLSIFSYFVFFSLYLFRLIVLCYHLLSPEIQCFHSTVYPVLQLAFAN